MKTISVLALFLLFSTTLLAQKESSGTFWKPSPANYEVKRALEIEALPFVYLSQGYHVGVGYRLQKFRFRASIIDAGTFNSENSNDKFERFETKGTFGIFAGYNIWKNLETYVFVDRQVFDIKQKTTSETKQLTSVTPGLGISYQFFIGRYFYVQPGLHLYMRGSQEAKFSDNTTYSLSTVDFFPVVRFGVRPWKKF
ncbi:MAG: outer membrane beta-barrel protein [Flammeovirgaceae bacterium]|jgi:hypothetical protein|nr:outer membrane beta-barrel protein [Flammeovirgaceae bacterium]